MNHLPEVLIGGYPNSGTSFLCHLVVHLGKSPGSPENLKSADSHNRWGYFEHLPIRKLVWEAGRWRHYSASGRKGFLPDQPLVFDDEPSANYANRIRRIAEEDNVEVYKDCSLPLTFRLFPKESKYIVISRQVEQVYESPQKAGLGGYQCSLEELGHSHRRYHELVDMMASEVECLTVQYEDFGTDFDGTLQSICDHLEVELDEGRYAACRAIFHPRRLSRRSGRVSVSKECRSGQARSDHAQLITIFATPKPFRGHQEIIQRNAIRSWTLLEPRPEVILFGDDEGTAEVAAELGLRHMPAVECSERGTPLISDMFEQAQRLGRHHILTYVNADIILMSDFVPAVSRVAQRFEQFLMIGRRWDVDLRAPLTFGETTWEDDLHHLLAERGSLHSVAGIDYFAFSRHLWPHIPPFAVGRVGWDNWMVCECLSSGKPVIDATRAVTAVHQNHDFGHLAGGWQERTGGVEAQRNLALGRDCLASGKVIGFTSHASWELTTAGPIRERWVPIARKASAPIEIRGAPPAPVEGSLPTLSVCMIVKDEEKLLAQCLDSIKGVADEIIIVDTGSTDRTVEIARRHTDKVYFHEWQDSFSEARNHSLSYATCDWILQIDADEELFQEDIPVLRGALAAAQNVPDIDAILVALLSDLPGKITSKHYFPRIHRRGRAHYEGIVHNQLVYQGKDMIAEIRFRHYGYALSPKEMERKAQRSEALLLRQIAEDPDNTFAWRNLLRIYRNRGDYDKVVERGQWVMDHPRATAEQRHSVASDMMVALTKMARYEEAEDVGLRALKELPDDLDIIYYLGMVHMASGQLDKAVSRLKQFLSVKRAEGRAGPQFNLLTMDHYASEAAVWNNLGQCDQRQGRAAEAIEAYRHAIESDPDQEGFYTNLAFALLRLGEVAQAESVLQKAAGRGVATAAAFKMLGDTLYLQHRLQESEAAYRRAIDFRQTDTDAHLGLGRALGGMGRLSDAADSLGKALELNPASRIAWLAWVKVHHRLGDRHETVSGLDRLLALGGLGRQENLTLAAISISLEAYDRAAAFLETYLQEKPEDVGALANLATCYAKMGRYAAALEGYRAVLHSDPENASVRRNLRALQRRLVRETAVQ